MYSKGEIVVYPMHGACCIIDFEEKTIDGIVKNYCILELPLGNLRIMLSEDCMPNAGLRKILPEAEITKLIKRACSASSKGRTDGASGQQKHKEHIERMKTGKLCDSAAVFYELYQKEKTKGLSGAEKKTMTTAKKIVMSEMMLGLNLTKEEAEAMIEKP